MIIVKEHKFVKDDNMGNKMYLRVMTDEQGVNQNANIHLKLSTESHYRSIGNYFFKDNTLYVKRESDKHLHRQTKSYGFNNDLLNDPYLNIQWIVADIDGVRYRFPMTLMKDYGSFLQFKKQGFELQRFLKFALIKPYKQTINNDNSPTSTDSEFGTEEE